MGPLLSYKWSYGPPINDIAGAIRTPTSGVVFPPTYDYKLSHRKMQEIKNIYGHTAASYAASNKFKARHVHGQTKFISSKIHVVQQRTPDRDESSWLQKGLTIS